MHKGVMLPNTEWEAWTIADLNAVANLGCTCVLVPVYGADNPVQGQRRNDLTYIQTKNPDIRVLYRMMTPNAMVNNPKAWALECTARAGSLPPGEYIVTNEDNIEGGIIGTEQVRWWQQFYDAFDPVCRRRLHRSALSPNGTYKQDWGALAPLDKLFCAVDIHVYPGSETDCDDIQNYTHLPVWVTEFNQMLPSSLSKYAKRIQGIVWFILRGTPDQSHYNLIEPYRTDFKKLPTGVTPVPVPTPTPPTPTRPRRIALAAGHHNSDGGNPIEIAFTGPMTKALAAEFRARGADVRVITPGDGLGQYPGGLRDVARNVVSWAAQGWQADYFIETHGQGLSDPSVRGGFVIYPDWDGDVDTDVQFTVGPKIMRELTASTGIPTYGNGVLSEKQTAVGIGGSRLGIFDVTAPLKSTLTRMIVEFATFTNPQDHAIMVTSAFQGSAATAVTDAIVGPVALNKTELVTFLTWADERLAAGQDFRGVQGLLDFETHLRGIGADAGNPYRYGWPVKT